MPTKSPLADPRPLLDALRAGTPLPGFPSDGVERARSLAAEPASAPPADVEALPEPLALALLEGSVLAGQPALAEGLAASGNKGLAKAAKKALYRLRSRGVEVAEPPRPSASEASRPVTVGPEPLPALLTSIDGTGERVLEIARPLRGGGVEAIQFLYSDEQGVQRLQVTELSRGDYRRVVKQATSPGDDAAVELSHAEALERLTAAAGLNLRTRTAFPQGLDTVLRHLGVQARDIPLEIPPPEPEDERLAHEGHKLHEEPEMRGWLPPMAELERLAHTVAELEASPLALTMAQRNEELIQAAHTQAHAFFATPAVRQLYASRLWEMALHFERTGKEQPARVARAEARRLAHGVSEPPSRYAERLFEKALLVTMARRAAPEVGEPAEIRARARAAEQQRAQSAETERRSPGGIILP
ncbi:hypothetical protein ATI61_102617 [Archangium gephyra]|uniref:Uncharacterized protein n=1 Tax=Archangium gephyra TaxID=48 RepID=A0AAC8QE30_9BACT|nr:hypothetical protein [Archangium gephyra]AKJ05558.1 Hypothetical protein AA314_07184 [Archangium gephyra]REG36240.1 hypothetical protein ATI61_102617 [Archangium gephyra]